MTLLDKLVEVLNETINAGESSRAMVGVLLLDSETTLDLPLPEDLIVSEDPNRVTMLGIINTAVVRSGDPRRLIAYTDDGLLLRVEAGPYPVMEVTETPGCDHHWMEWRGHHDSENEGRMRCTRCSKFKGDLR